eukprot:c45896_g1_i1.p1 GENE.c45896_g1_i1~~c45896_g1_i1.p1  ORF type:complete len:244 (+),score=40.97 c45896_g1_i1:27-734(+)
MAKLAILVALALVAAVVFAAKPPALPTTFSYTGSAELADGTIIFDATESHDYTTFKYATFRHCVSSTSQEFNCTALSDEIFDTYDAVTSVTFNNETKQCTTLCRAGKTCQKPSGQCQIPRDGGSVFYDYRFATAGGKGNCGANSLLWVASVNVSNVLLKSTYCFMGSTPKTVSISAGKTVIYTESFSTWTPLSHVPPATFAIPTFCSCASAAHKSAHKSAAPVAGAFAERVIRAL